MTENRKPNRLINEKSPYLLRHAYNLVDWFPWCEEAFQKAKDEDKLILLSIGYSTCHWCHVMERESFEDEATATVIVGNGVELVSTQGDGAAEGDDEDEEESDDDGDDDGVGD